MLPVLPDQDFFLLRIALSAVLAGLLLWQLQRRLASPARWPFAVAPGVLPLLISLALFIPLFSALPTCCTGWTVRIWCWPVR